MKDSARRADWKMSTRLVLGLNTLPWKKSGRSLLKEMFAEIGDGCYIEPPFYANWAGKFMHFGEGVSVQSSDPHWRELLDRRRCSDCAGCDDR